jgi:ComF family protein
VESFPLDENDLCTICRENMPNFDSVYSFGNYEGSLRALIHLFKYGKIESLALPLSRLILRTIPLDETFDMAIAMPMHWRKQWERGFNQAQLLAQPVAKRYGLKLSTNLVRRRYTKAQAGLGAAERSENLKDSFRVKRPAQLAGKRVLLVDDVFTTGSTLRMAAESLKAAGAAHVTAVTLARVDQRGFQSDVVFTAGKRNKALQAGSGFD